MELEVTLLEEGILITVQDIVEVARKKRLQAKGEKELQLNEAMVPKMGFVTHEELEAMEERLTSMMAKFIDERATGI